MLMPIIMMIMMLSIVSCFTLAQETPTTTAQTEEQVADQNATTENVSSEVPTEEKAEPSPQEESPTKETSSEAQQAPSTEEKSSTEEMVAEEPQTEKAPTETEEAAQKQAPTKMETSAPEQPTAEAPKEDETTTSSEAIPTQPAPIKEEEVVIPEEDIETIAPAGIDTVSLDNPQGNWLFKRIWWERAEERYEKIRLLVDAIWEFRNKFFNERNTLDRKILDPFYINVGIDQGELQIILSEINDFFEKQREQQGDLTEQERMLYESYATEEETLKQLKIDVETIAQLDNEIDNALGTLMSQINRVRQFETEAWNNFKEIAHILNDTRARELYYMIEGAARNIKNMSNYLEQEFFAHFNKLISEAKNRVVRVQNQIEALKEKGIKFQRQAELLEQQKQQAEQEEEEDEEEVKPKPKLGWFGWIGSLFSDTFNYIFSIIRMPYDMIFGK